MARFLALIVSVLGSFTLFAASASAEPAGAHYRLQLANPAPAAKVIVRGLMFNCAGDSCTAAAGASRPAVICAAAAREFGQIATFSAAGAALDDEALAKCNAKARIDTTRIVQR
ncbi:hypothetical protein GVO57_05320 [Sphingomonas changnyeongensis]|uniref:UrcA family protein n=1 Tax=Sphingomonas changnyeongensis TaxID=2698679 RepID=A0A7Z2NV36_9SPHN|nr:hypothetical protein [Sphingomonas changnyeongensis]QHL90363.1 hypothetical protein GVO57_05320 [Sphingomonas changnyeongensis]